MEPTDYTTWEPFELIEALELAGPRPPDALIDAALGCGEAIADDLLTLLAAAPDPDWRPDDPRRYRDVHAALLLIELRDTRVLDALDTIARDEPERWDNLEFWVVRRLGLLGEPAVAFAQRLAETVEIFTSASYTIMLGHLARVPDLRPQVIPLLRDLLPAVDEEGYPVVPDDDDDLEYGGVEQWTWAAEGLMHARDTTSRDRILDLYEAEVLDDWIINPDEFEAGLEAPDPDQPLPSLAAYYAEMEAEEQDMQAKVDAMREGMEPLRQLAELLDLDEVGEMELMARLIGKGMQGGEPDDEFVYDALLDIDPEAADRYERLILAPPPPPVSTTKIGRNERVVIEDPDTGETLTLKYKHAQGRLEAGWELIGLDEG